LRNPQGRQHRDVAARTRLFGLLPFAHGNPLANEFHGPFLVGLIRKEIPHRSGFPFEIEGCDPHIPSRCHCGNDSVV
jgi:hypothetical protein